jgi:hypothetical protein
VSNALKFTERGEVAVTLDVDGDDLVARVVDTGIGIGREDQAHVFDMFGRSIPRTAPLWRDGARALQSCAASWSSSAGGRARERARLRLDVHGAPGPGADAGGRSRVTDSTR